MKKPETISYVFHYNSDEVFLLMPSTPNKLALIGIIFLCVLTLAFISHFELECRFRYPVNF